MVYHRARQRNKRPPGPTEKKKIEIQKPPTESSSNFAQIYSCVHFLLLPLRCGFPEDKQTSTQAVAPPWRAHEESARGRKLRRASCSGISAVATRHSLLEGPPPLPASDISERRSQRLFAPRSAACSRLQRAGGRGPPAHSGRPSLRHWTENRLVAAVLYDICY